MLRSTCVTSGCMDAATSRPPTPTTTNPRTARRTFFMCGLREARVSHTSNTAARPASRLRRAPPTTGGCDRLPAMIRFNVNDQDVALDAPPMARLLDVLREGARLTGTKEGCGEGECGAC